MKESKVISIGSTTNWEAIIKEAQNFKYFIILRDHYRGNAAGEYCLTSILEALYKEQNFWFYNIERPVHTVIMTDMDVPSNISQRNKLYQETERKTYEISHVYMPMRPACDGRATERTQPEAFAQWRKDRQDAQAKIDALKAVIKNIEEQLDALDLGFPSSLYHIER